MPFSLENAADRQAREALRAAWRSAGLYSNLTTAQEIARGVQVHGGEPIVFAGANGGSDFLLLRDLHREGLALAGSLQAHGAEPGTPILVQAPADRLGASALIAAWALGSTVIPLDLGTAVEDLREIVAETGAQTMVAIPEWRGTAIAARLSEAAAMLGLERVISLGADLPSVPLGQVPDPLPTDISVVMYTSGSTARPKGVMHSHESFLFGIATGGSNPASRTLACFPAGHVASLYGIMRPLLTGDYTVVLDRWSARRAAELIEEHRITASAGTPFFLQTLLDEADRTGRDISSLGQFLCGAAPVPPPLVVRAEARGIVGWRTYGSTEHPAISTGLPSDSLDARMNTDGRVVPVNDVRIVDEAGIDVARGQDGEILSRGPKQFVGYNDHRLDSESFLEGTWFRTGDCGHLDAAGYLVVTDRLKDIIIRGGENISAREIEDVLIAHPEIHDVAVCAGPDPLFGEVPVAVIVGTPDLESVSDWCRDSGLAPHKIPVRLVYMESLPRTSAGKIRRVELRKSVG